jgi:DHA3 family macrolide efflux protein-like MFS transporter
VLATATLVALLPPIVIGPVAGALVDRWNRKSVMLASDGVVALVSLAVAVLFALDLASVGAIFAALLVRAVGSTFHGPAMLAATSLMVPERHLARIQGLNQMLQGGALIVAAPLGGLLVALLSMEAIMLVDVGTALVAILPLVFVAVPRVAVERDPGLSGGVRRTLRDVAAGLRYIADRPGHRALVGIATGVNLLLVPAFSLLPLLIRDSLDGEATDLAWSNSAFGVGSIAGGILLGLWGGFERRIVTMLVGFVALGLATLALGLAPTLVVAGVAMLGVGFVVPLINGPVQAVLQATVAPEYQGRVFTLIGSLAGLTAPVGLLLAAPVAEVLGVRAWYVAGAAACVVLGLAGFAMPALGRIEDVPGGAEAVAHPLPESS